MDRSGYHVLGCPRRKFSGRFCTCHAQGQDGWRFVKMRPTPVVRAVPSGYPWPDPSELNDAVGTTDEI